MRLPTTTLEQSLLNNGYQAVIAVDEVGMGCLAGPVVVCAVTYTKNFPDIPGVRDSKLLSARQREQCFAEIKNHNVPFSIAYCYPKTIDKLNIYQAARAAMRRAIKKLPGDFVLLDGPNKISGLSLPQQAIIKGDQTVFSIACASVIAKVFRDRMMKRYAKRFPQYGFEQHKGYGTKLHLSMLSQYGPTKIHRKSFAPMRNIV